MNNQLNNLTLHKGAHKADQDEMCIMEAVAFFAKESWTDKPECACPVVSAFLRNVNDRATDEDRQKLKVLIPALLNSRDASKEQNRAYMFADAAVRDFAPRALDKAGLTEQAAKLRGCAPRRCPGPLAPRSCAPCF